MYEMSDPAIGLRKKDLLQRRRRGARAHRHREEIDHVIRVWAEQVGAEMRPVGFSTSTLKPECVSPTLREDYQEAVSPW